MVTKLDDRDGSKVAFRVHDQFSVLEFIQIRLDHKQVGARLYRKETRSRNVDSMSTLEMFDGGTSSRLQLDDFFVCTFLGLTNTTPKELDLG
jgi:hypothetical protein